ncbi:MAG TPA: prephenate dehydrogenase [Tepidisphaeraceae bacterium]|jgi:prephenate dehydrogenase
MQPKRLSILGVGLLGGSIGLAVRSRIRACRVIGYGHRSTTLANAQQSGAIDEAYEKVDDAVRGSDLIILCTPVGTFSTILPQIAATARPGSIVTDVGSTKRTVVATAQKVLPAGVHFVGSHPMAGSEKRGVDFARADLFDDALCITTPTEHTDPWALEEVEAFWRSLGMRTTRLSPEEHDRRLAEVSHLPHAVAAALIAMQQDASLDLCGKGFLDATRIASGDAALWRDILLDNRDNLRAAIGGMKHVLDDLLAMLENKDAAAVAKWLETSAHRRQELLARRSNDPGPE